MITEPRMGEAGDAATPSGACTNSKDQTGATRMYWFLPDTTTGPILSIRVFKFGSLYGLELLILGLRDDKQTVWVTACLGKELVYRQKGFDGTSTAQLDQSRSTSSSNAQSIPYARGRTPPCFTLGETPCRLKCIWSVAVKYFLSTC